MNLLSEKVFSGLTQNEVQSVIGLQHGDIVFHSLQVQFKSYAQSVISFEGRTQTLEVTELVEQSLSCSDAQLLRWEVEPLSSVVLGSSASEDHGMMQSQVNWRCGSKQAGNDVFSQWQGVLQIYFSAAKNEVLGSSVQVRVVEKKMQ